jgi:hypothetical protein
MTVWPPGNPAIAGFPGGFLAVGLRLATIPTARFAIALKSRRVRSQRGTPFTKRIGLLAKVRDALLQEGLIE